MLAIVLVAVAVAVAQGDVNMTRPAGAGSNSSASGRIVGGERCPNCPWMASMQMRYGRSWHHLCGGTIIKPVWILSAAHCFEKPQQPWRYRARTSSASWSEGGRLSYIYEIAVHERYSGSDYLEHDIALVRVSRRISFNEWTSALGLPRQGSLVPAGTVLTASGWGITHESSQDVPKYYRYVRLRLTSKADCLQYFHELTDGHLCAYGEGKDSCSGDSGGPLYNSRSSQVVGIVSFGYGCGRPGWPGVYTDVASYANWIKRIVRKVDNKSSASSTCRSLLVSRLVSLLCLLCTFSNAT